MKKHLLPIIISIPLVVTAPLTVLSNCGGSGDQPATLVYKVTLECEEGGTIEGGYYDQKTGVRWVEVEAGGKWKNTVDRIKTNPNEGMMFYSWRDENGNLVEDNTVIDKPRTFKARWTNADFEKDSWKHLCELSAEGGLDKILEFYGHQTTLIGKERGLTLLGNTYKARVIGENHDDLADGTGKAALTFQLTSLVSNSSGGRMQTLWSKQDINNPDYVDTIVRKNVDGQGTGEESQHIWDKSCLELLKEENEDLYNGLKKVTKVYKKSDLKEYSYDTNLFILTTKEIGYKPDSVDTNYNPKEGEVYEYWKDKSDSDRILRSIDGNIFRYSLVTKRYAFAGQPERHIYYVNTDGSIQHDVFYSQAKDSFYGISFAFCI